MWSSSRCLERLGRGCRAQLGQADQVAEGRAAVRTVPRLLELAPPGTQDPTPYLYDVTYQYVTGLLCLAACANMLVRPAIGTTAAKAAATAKK